MRKKFNAMWDSHNRIQRVADQIYEKISAELPYNDSYSFGFSVQKKNLSRQECEWVVDMMVNQGFVCFLYPEDYSKMWHTFSIALPRGENVEEG